MKLRMCAGALTLSLLVSLAALPVAAARLAEDVMRLVTIEFRPMIIDAR
jgi:hypothetical protein